MVLPELLELLAIAVVLFFGAIAIIFSIKEEQKDKILKEREEMQRHRLYEISILKEIQERIGYELDIEKIIDVITGSLKGFFAYSTISSLVLKEDKIIFKTNVEEGVSRAFIAQVEKSMLASLSAMTDKPLPDKIEEEVTGSILDDLNTLPTASFFHIPLIVSNKVVGVINIASTKPGLYKENEMTILYKITNQASNALTRFQAVLTTEKEKLMSLIGSLDDGVFMLDEKNNLLVINEMAKKLLGINKATPNIFDLFSALPAQFDFPGKIQQAIGQNLKIEEKEIIINEKTIQAFITPVLSSQKVIGVSVLLHDITLEKNLAQMKEDFTNTIVHELRAPLTAIRGAASILSTDGYNLEKNQHEKLTILIHDQAKKLLEEVSSLLDAAKLESGRLTIEKKETDVKKLIEEKTSFFLPEAQRKNIALSSQIYSPLPQVKLDPFRVGQVLNNLISNSLKFTPDGGKITVSAQMTPPASGQDKEQPKIVVTVSDTGIGIPKEDQDKLFSKFAQGGSPGSEVKQITFAEKGKSLGTGLGLYITKGIIEAHGGTIHLESEVGRGTTITFTLPAEFAALSYPTHVASLTAN